MSIKTILLAFTAMAISACAPGNDFPEVGISAGLLSDDIERVGQVRPQSLTASSLEEVEGGNVVIAGTIGHSGLVDELIEAGKIDVSGIVMQEICIY